MRGTERIKDPLPAPTECRFCAGPVQLVDNKAIYGRNYGWPKTYLCDDCGAFVGCHPNTEIPLGTLADDATREARKRAHSAFDHIWRDKHLSRDEAYLWLAGKLGIERRECHIGMFEVERCNAASIHARGFLKEKAARLTSNLGTPS